MSSIVDSSGIPIGRVGESRAPEEGATVDYEKVSMLEALYQAKKTMEDEGAISKVASVSSRDIDPVVSFWKGIYFSHTVEGRSLNGIEAYELGDETKTSASKVDKGPYIAMCNLMALEALRMLGDNMPKAEDAKLLAFATDREREIAEFWKTTFAPTRFQSEWAWKACLSVLAGSQAAYNELLVDYKDQLP